MQNPSAPSSLPARPSNLPEPGHWNGLPLPSCQRPFRPDYLPIIQEVCHRALSCNYRLSVVEFYLRKPPGMEGDSRDLAGECLPLLIGKLVVDLVRLRNQLGYKHYTCWAHYLYMSLPEGDPNGDYRVLFLVTEPALALLVSRQAPYPQLLKRITSAWIGALKGVGKQAGNLVAIPWDGIQTLAITPSNRSHCLESLFYRASLYATVDESRGEQFGFKLN
jgi:hypothetical protein